MKPQTVEIHFHDGSVLRIKKGLLSINQGAIEIYRPIDGKNYFLLVATAGTWKRAFYPKEVKGNERRQGEAGDSKTDSLNESGRNQLAT